MCTANQEVSENNDSGVTEVNKTVDFNRYQTSYNAKHYFLLYQLLSDFNLRENNFVFTTPLRQQVKLRSLFALHRYTQAQILKGDTTLYLQIRRCISESERAYLCA